MEGIDAHVAQIGSKLAQHLLPFSQAEHRTFFRIPKDRDHQLFEDLAASLDQVEVAVGRWIEGTGIDSDAFVQSSSQEAAPAERAPTLGILCG